MITIRARGLGKRYRVGTAAERYGSLRDMLAAAARLPLNNLRNLRRLTRFDDGEEQDVLWALKDVDFDIEQGRAVGIIGRNGAGKSTLLKLLSRITEPSAGRAEIVGRVGALLEVGTGFHPDLTGRENLLLNGSILGMDRNYINRKFDEIVSFAGVERHIDTPVKRYSTGMHLRLAFAVAAHLEPDVLVVDEVLAVGDAEFQKKCLGKIGEVAGEGRTVLFVSHQMASIQRLCDTAIWLERGLIQRQGDTSEVISDYLSHVADLSRIPLTDRLDRSGTGAIRFTAIELQDEAGRSTSSFSTGSGGYLLVHFEQAQKVELEELHVSVSLNGQNGERISVLRTDLPGDDFRSVRRSAHCVRIRVGPIPLVPGRYGLTLFSRVNGDIADWVQDAGHMDVESGDFFGTGKLPHSGHAIFLIPHEFELI